MSEGERLSPEAAMRRLETEASDRPRLKIFFGMSAGVGKTYAMLKEAHILIGRGSDLVIGWVEAHGRRETDLLLEGIPRILPREFEYRGIALEEMDLDAVLARKPGIVLVDELAHTNAPGSRHPKRYQDVLELLDAGISVYTTVNIQHLESMSDSVELLTFVPIRERVPDSVFDRADEVQMVDIPPGELIKRLEEGKVYTGDASREAVRNFFTMQNLAVLREIALRQASQLASHKLLDIMRDGSAQRPAAAAQRILVAVSSSPNSESLIRWARRLAYSLKSEAYCVNVESGVELGEADKSRLQKNLDLARSLGVRVETVQSADVVSGVVSYAREHGISIIIVGKSGLSVRRLFGRRGLTDRIIRESGDIAVFAVQESDPHDLVLRRVSKRLSSSPLWQYAAALLAVAAVTGLNTVISGYMGYWVASIPYLALISLLALQLERRPVFFAGLLSALAWDFFFIPPRFTLSVNKPEDYLTLALYFLLSITAGWATSRLKANENMLVARERKMSLLRDLASGLAGKSGLEAILGEGAAFMGVAFGAEAITLLAAGEGGLKLRQGPAGFAPDDKEESAASYCFRSGQATGRYTATLPVVAWHFVPLETPNGTIGVIGVKREGVWTDDDELFLGTATRTLSLAVERELLAEQNRSNALTRESERVSKIILDSVSHELRTPLTVIKGSASVLSDGAVLGDREASAALADEIQEAVERLDGIVENLLSMNRLESGPFKLRRTSEELGDLLASALDAAAKELSGHEIELAIARDLPPLSCDAGLVIQVLVNLLTNAARYSGAGSHIAVRAEADEASLRCAVEDDGPGVAPADLPRLFDKFFRAEHAAPGGTGLGLSICKGVVEAHGGRIEAHNLSPRGFAVSFELPAEPPAKPTAKASP
jgi:two-component system sensor histidine kinase KdpD